MAHALQIDTLAFSKKLREAGADEKLAEAIVEGITAADTSELATKADLAAIEAKLKHDIGSVRQEISDVRAEIHKTSRTNLMSIGALLGLFFLLDKIWPVFSIGG